MGTMCILLVPARCCNSLAPDWATKVGDDSGAGERHGASERTDEPGVRPHRSLNPQVSPSAVRDGVPG